MDTGTAEIYTLSLHDALPISCSSISTRLPMPMARAPPLPPSPVTTAMIGVGSEAITFRLRAMASACPRSRSEEHTSELQSQTKIVCRLQLEKKKYNKL